MELSTVTTFLKKYKSYIFLPIICVLQLLACFYHDLWIVATVIAVALVVFSDFAHIIYYTLFFQMFSVLGHFSVILTFVASAVICIKYIIGLVKKTEKLYRDVRFYTHGLACQIACNSILVKEDEIKKLIKNLIENLSR